MNVEHKIGNTFYLPLTLQSASGAAINITGFEIAAKAKKDIKSTDYLFELSIGSGITITDEATGNIY